MNDNILEIAKQIENEGGRLYYDLIGSLQPPEHHPEGDSFNHTMMVIDKAAELTDDLEISCIRRELSG